MPGDNHTNIFSIILFLIVQIPLLGVYLYYLSISLFALVKRKEALDEGPREYNRFAVLIAAHNEENVIPYLLKNLLQLDYPKDKYDIFVIADNCTDSTAAIARQFNALVYERQNHVQKGKGFALEWMFDILLHMDVKYDAVCVLDADNLVSSNFLRIMNAHLHSGHKAVQGYIDSKNPFDSHVSCHNAITFWIASRMLQLPRYYLGLSGVLWGTGFVISTDILKEIGWSATCITEDLEFTIKLALRGMKVYWAHDAVVYDEKPLKFSQSWNQRVRWMKGHCYCLENYVKKLIIKAFADRDMVAFDLAVHLMQPLSVICVTTVMILGLIVSGYGYLHHTSHITFTNANFIAGNVLNIVATASSFYINLFFVLLEKKLNIKKLWFYITYPLYTFTWVPIMVQGFIHRNNSEWFHTLHTRGIELDNTY